jgi:hypothetical protein
MHTGCSFEFFLFFGQGVDLVDNEINSLANYVVDGLTGMEGQTIF